jgi:hypothetical protein
MSADRYLLLETKEDYNNFLKSEFKNPGAAWHWGILNSSSIDFGSNKDNYPEELEEQPLTVKNIDKLISSLKTTTSLKKEANVRTILESNLGKVILFYTN